MAGATTTFDIDGAHGQRIRALMMRMADLREPLEHMGGHVQRRVVAAFTRGRDSAPGEPPTVRSARLSQSIVYAVDGSRLEVGTNVIYAAIQQFGGQAGRGHAVTLPARPYLEWKEDDFAYLSRALERHFTID